MPSIVDDLGAGDAGLGDGAGTRGIFARIALPASGGAASNAKACEQRLTLKHREDERPGGEAPPAYWISVGLRRMGRTLAVLRDETLLDFA